MESFVANTQLVFFSTDLPRRKSPRPVTYKYEDLQRMGKALPKRIRLAVSRAEFAKARVLRHRESVAKFHLRSLTSHIHNARGTSILAMPSVSTLWPRINVEKPALETTPSVKRTLLGRVYNFFNTLRASVRNFAKR